MTDLPPLIDGTDPALVDAASTTIRGYCDWHIAPQLVDDVLTLDGSGTPTMMLPSLYVLAVTSVVEDGLTLDPSEYEWSQDGRLRKSEPWQRWSSHLRGVVVTLTHGYAACPGDLAQVGARLMAAGAPSGHGALKQAGPFAYDLTQAALSADDVEAKSARTTLDRYRVRPGF